MAYGLKACSCHPLKLNVSSQIILFFSKKRILDKLKESNKEDQKSENDAEKRAKEDQKSGNDAEKRAVNKARPPKVNRKIHLSSCE